MKVLRYIFLAAAALIAQSTFLKLVAIGSIQPDLVLLVLFYIALREGSYGATIAGFCTGLIQDVYSPETLGLNALCKSLVGFGLGYCRRGIFVESLTARAFILFMAVLAHDMIRFLVSLWPEVGRAFGSLMSSGLPAALYTALVGYVVFYLLARREQPGPRRESS